MSAKSSHCRYLNPSSCSILLSPPSPNEECKTDWVEMWQQRKANPKDTQKGDGGRNNTVRKVNVDFKLSLNKQPSFYFYYDEPREEQEKNFLQREVVQCSISSPLLILKDTSLNWAEIDVLFPKSKLSY